MRFGSVNIPRTLVDARKQGRLAVFAGAGVSIDPPSNLPSFNGLVDEVADGVGHQKQGERFDQFLGRLHQNGNGVQVHDIVHRIVDKEGGPTNTHLEIAKLFDEPQNVRIVTTNFDRHFTSAVASVFDTPIPHFYAPALPLGNDFSGVVHLHGSLIQDPHRLILTDGDFSRAYLTEGWARRFLEQLFSEYFVLFLGYSHGDAVIEYLARGIPADADMGRFALASEPEKSGKETSTDWRYLGINPVWYPTSSGSRKHEALPKALQKWNRYATQSARERTQQISDFTSKLPSKLNTEELDALLDRLRTRDGARSFRKSARHVDWMYWASSEELLDSLFETAELTTVQEELCHWVARHLLWEHPDETFALIAPHSGVLNPQFWNQLTRSLWDINTKNSIDPDLTARWIQVLLRSPSNNAPNLDLLLTDGLRMPADSSSVLMLLNYLTEPYALFEEARRFLSESEDNDRVPATTTMSVGIRIRGHSLRLAREKVIKPHLEAIGGDLLPLLAIKIRSYHRLCEDAGDLIGARRETRLSYRRSAIEEHDEDRYNSRDALDQLIDTARDVLEWVIANTPKKGIALVDTWTQSNIPLLERLAVHGMSEAGHVSPDAKVTWLVEQNWLYDLPLKHEVFRLVALEYPKAGKAVREQLVNQIWSAWPTEAMDEPEERKHAAYRVYNILHWLQEHDGDCDLLKTKLKNIGKEFPEFEPRKHPDLDTWGMGGFRSVETEDRSEELLRQHPRKRIEDIKQTLKSDFVPSFVDQINHEDVQRAVAESFKWGFELAEYLLEEGVANSKEWRPIWRGFTETALDDADWEKLLSLIETNPPLHNHSRGIGQLLEKRSEPGSGDLPEPLLPRAERIADALLCWAAADPSPVSGGDWATQLLNHSGTSLTRFFLHSLFHRYRASKNGEFLLTQEDKKRFENLLARSDIAAQAGQMITGSRLDALYALDEEWTLDRLIPNFGWCDGNAGNTVWLGLLRMGRNVSPSLAQQLQPVSRSTFPRIACASDELAKRFTEFVADLAVSGAVDPMEDNWLAKFMIDVPQRRIQWANRLRILLGRLDPDRTDEIWTEWLEAYWTQRIDGKPQLTPLEVGAMMAWVPYLGAKARQAVNLLERGPAPELDRHAEFFFRFDDDGFASRFPRLSTRLLRFSLHSSAEYSASVSNDVSSILTSISEEDGCPDDTYAELVDRAIELNFIDAGTGQNLIDNC
jgi:hypothetical protein